MTTVRTGTVLVGALLGALLLAACGGPSEAEREQAFVDAIAEHEGVDLSEEWLARDTLAMGSQPCQAMAGIDGVEGDGGESAFARWLAEDEEYALVVWDAAVQHLCPDQADRYAELRDQAGVG